VPELTVLFFNTLIVFGVKDGAVPAVTEVTPVTELLLNVCNIPVVILSIPPVTSADAARAALSPEALLIPVNTVVALVSNVITGGVVPAVKVTPFNTEVSSTALANR